jgi:hypothetical protein
MFPTAVRHVEGQAAYLDHKKNLGMLPYREVRMPAYAARGGHELQDKPRARSPMRQQHGNALHEMQSGVYARSEELMIVIAHWFAGYPERG